LSRRPPRLYLITDRGATAGRPLLDVVRAALRGAERFRGDDGRLPVAVSLREKDLQGAALLALGRALAAITREAGADLYVNGRVDVALACGAEGVHLPADGLAPADVRALAPQLTIAASTHNPIEVTTAAAAGVDFVVFGPVFETPSKRGLVATRGLEGVREATNRKVPVLALGGITAENAEACLAAGASGVACIRAILACPDPDAAVEKFLLCFRAHDRSKTRT
jgi:thiamine-phosphate pyrophosphorylase